jgi:microcystin-dependent protein
MSTPFLGQLKIVSFNFAPKGWAMCNGQILSIAQNAALFSLLGTTYGGNGIQTFALPNLQGKVPVHTGNSLTLGGVGGEADVTLNTNQIRAHSHAVMAVSNAATAGSASNAFLATTPTKGMGSIYGSSPDGTLAANSAVSPAGSTQPHVNQQPYLVLNFIIALQGIFPSRS